jgi:putative spermidine/putrescine transport system permease protein
MSTIRSKKNILLLLLPGIVFILLFFLLPLLYVLFESFQSEQAFFTLSRYIKVLKDTQFQNVFMRTLKIALIVTPLAVFLGYPSAYLMTKVSAKKKSILTSLVILPLMTSPVARTFAWIVILGKYGIINKTLTTFRILEEPTRLLYTEGAIIVGLLQLFMPIMVLTLVSSMENAPSEVEEAAMSLGSNRIGTFFRVVVPLSFEGLMMGITLVFTGCFTAYVTPAILGGAKVLTLSTLMRQNALVLMDWEGATVIAVIMILTTLVIYNGVRLFKPRNLV